jgi:plasmid stabilization system protein ParE
LAPPSPRLSGIGTPRSPEAGRADLRELIESPYRVIYRIAPSAIEVIAIVHGRQELGSHLPG